MSQDGDRSKADGPGEALVDEPTSEALENEKESDDKSEWEKAAEDQESGALGGTGDTEEDAPAGEPKEAPPPQEPPG